MEPQSSREATLNSIANTTASTPPILSPNHKDNLPHQGPSWIAHPSTPHKSALARVPSIPSSVSTSWGCEY